MPETSRPFSYKNFGNLREVDCKLECLEADVYIADTSDVMAKLEASTCKDVSEKWLKNALMPRIKDFQLFNCKINEFQQ